MFQPAVSCPECAGKGANLVAEQFAFEVIGWDGAAVDGDKGPFSPLAEAVNGTGGKVLARAGFADDQQVHAGLCRRPDLFSRLAHDLRTPRQDRLEFVRSPGAGAQSANFQGQRPLFQRLSGHGDQMCGSERLFDEIIGTTAHGLHRQLDIAMAGHQDHRHIGVDFQYPAEKRDAVHARHSDIGDDHTRKAGCDLGQDFFGRIEAFEVETIEIECLTGCDADVLLIVQKQETAFRRLTPGLLAVAGVSGDGGVGGHWAATVCRSPDRSPVSAASAGQASSSMPNSAPPSGWFLAVSLPPKSRMML